MTQLEHHDDLLRLYNPPEPSFTKKGNRKSIFRLVNWSSELEHQRQAYTIQPTFLRV